MRPNSSTIPPFFILHLVVYAQINLHRWKTTRTVGIDLYRESNFNSIEPLSPLEVISLAVHIYSLDYVVLAFTCNATIRWIPFVYESVLRR